MQVCSAEKKKTKGHQGEGVPAASKSLVAMKMAYEKAKQAMDAANLNVMKEGAKVIELYGNYYPMRPGSHGKRLPWPK